MTSFGALKEGIVHRQGGLGLWKKRLLLLQDDVLYMFSNEKSMEAAETVLITCITSVSDVHIEESKRDHTFRIEYAEKSSKDPPPAQTTNSSSSTDYAHIPQKASVVLACNTASEFESWRESLESVRTYDHQRRLHEQAYDEGGEWGRARPLGREILRASKGVFNKTVILTGMLKSLRFGPGGSGAGSISTGDAEKMRESVNLEFFNAAIGEMSILLAKDTVKFLESPFDGARFQSVSESAKQMINLLATLPKLAKGTSNEAAVQFHANALQQELQRVRNTRLPRVADEVDSMLVQLEIEMEKLLDAGENEERLATSKLLNSCANQFVTSCKWIVDILDSKEDGDLIMQTARELGPAIDDYRIQVKNEFYFKQGGEELMEERQHIFGILTYISQIIQDSKRTGASVDRFVNTSKKIRETMLLSAPPAFMEFYDEAEDEDGSDESAGSTRSSTSSLSLSSTSLPRMAPPRLQLETVFPSGTPPLSRSPRSSNSFLSSTPPVSSLSPRSALSSTLSCSLPDAPSFLGSLQSKGIFRSSGSHVFNKQHSNSPPPLHIHSPPTSPPPSDDEVDPFGGDPHPATYSSSPSHSGPLSFLKRLSSPRMERSQSYSIPGSSSGSPLRERSVSYNNGTSKDGQHNELSPRASVNLSIQGTPSILHPLSGLTVEQEHAWDSLIADAKKFAKIEYKRKHRSPVKFATLTRAFSPSIPTSPLRNSSSSPSSSPSLVHHQSSLDFSPLVNEIDDWSASGEEKLPLSLMTPTVPPVSTPPISISPTPTSPTPIHAPIAAPSPVLATSPTSSLSTAAAAFLASKAKKQAKQEKKSKKKVTIAHSGSNVVLEPKIPAFLLQAAPAPARALSPPPTQIPLPSSPLPTPTSPPTATLPSSPPTPSPLSPLIPPPSLFTPPMVTIPASPIIAPPAPYTPPLVPPSPTTTVPVNDSAPCIVPLTPSPNFPADSLPPFKVPELAPIPLPVIDLATIVIKPHEGELPEELSQVFMMQTEHLLMQQKKVMQKHQDYLLQQFEEQRRALLAIQRQAFEAYKFVATPVPTEAPRQFVTARPKAMSSAPLPNFGILSTSGTIPVTPTSTTPSGPLSPRLPHPPSLPPPPDGPLPLVPEDTISSPPIEPVTPLPLTSDQPDVPPTPDPIIEDALLPPPPPSDIELPPPPPLDTDNNIINPLSFSEPVPRPPSMAPPAPVSSDSTSSIPRPPSIVSQPHPIPRPLPRPVSKRASRAISVAQLASALQQQGTPPKPRSPKLPPPLCMPSHQSSPNLLSSHIKTPLSPPITIEPLSPPTSRLSFADSPPPSRAPPSAPLSSSPLPISSHEPLSRSSSSSNILSSSPLLSPRPVRKPPGPPTKEMSFPSIASSPFLATSASAPSLSPTFTRVKKMPHPPSGTPIGLADLLKQADARKSMPKNEK